jgi:hypothetical protein
MIRTHSTHPDEEDDGAFKWISPGDTKVGQVVIECCILCSVDRASGYACNETNLMHYISSVYSVTIPLRVSGLLVAYYQEVAMYTGCTRRKGQYSGRSWYRSF